MSQKPLESLSATLFGRAILVFGDVMLDEYISGEAYRVSPEAPVPIVEFRSRSFRPGGAANVAANIAVLGGTPLVAGVVGQDEAAERLTCELRQYGVEVSGIVTDAERPTTTKLRVIAQNQQILRLDREMRTPLAAPLEEQVREWIMKQLPAVDACIISDYAKGFVSSRLSQFCIAQARKRDVPVVVDPKGTDYTIYRGATVLKPNVHDVRRILHRELPDTRSLLEGGKELSAIFRDSVVIITRGPQGMLLFQNGFEPQSFPTTAHKVCDVTGAGDTVAATLVVALASGLSLQRSVRLANLAAGIVVAKPGTAVVTLDELSNEFAKIDAHEGSAVSCPAERQVGGLA